LLLCGCPYDPHVPRDGLNEGVGLDLPGNLDLYFFPDGAPLPACHPKVQKKCANSWCEIPAGCFIMGAPPSEPCQGHIPDYGKETQHQVTFTHSFEISQTEITQSWYQGLMGENPSGFPGCGGNCPVEGVNWHQAAVFCNKLSVAKGKTECYTCTGTGADMECSEAPGFTGKAFYTCPGYRMPTDAEWEYAYRGGSTHPFYTGPLVGSCTADPNADLAGWNDMNAKLTTHPAGKKAANGWGVYDMSGNVWEWVNDLYKEDLGSSPVTDPLITTAPTDDRMLRGGCWDTDAGTNRAAGVRRYRTPETVDPTFLGVRVVRTLNP